MLLATKQVHPHAIAIFKHEDGKDIEAVAFVINDDNGQVCEILMRPTDPALRLAIAKRVLNLPPDSPETAERVDYLLRGYRITVVDTPYASVHDMLAAVHGEVWDAGGREITWQADKDAHDPSRRFDSWTVTFKCGPHHQFAFWRMADPTLPGMPADHPEASGGCLGPGFLMNPDGTPVSEDGIEFVELPWQADKHHWTGREFRIRLTDTRTCAAATKERLARLVLNALGRPYQKGDYVAVTSAPMPDFGAKSGSGALN